jgi:hypothetical protein
MWRYMNWFSHGRHEKESFFRGISGNEFTSGTLETPVSTLVPGGLDNTRSL